MPVVTPVANPQVRQLSDGNSQGTILGQSASDEIGFYGLTSGVPQILQGSLAGANGVLNLNAVSNSPSAINANTTSEKSFTLAGVASTDMVVSVVKPTSQAGIAVGTARVSATNTVLVTMGNVTTGTLTPTTTETYLFVTAPASFQLSAVLSPASVAGSTTSEQVFTVAGVVPGMAVAVNKPTLQAGLMISGARVVAANQVAITFVNVTVSTAITPTASETYLFFGARGLRIQPVMERILATLTPVSVAADETAEQTFTVTGLVSGNIVSVTKPSTQKGLALVGARVSAANTLALNFANTTAVALTPPSEQYIIAYFPLTPPAAGANSTQLAAMGVDPGLAMEEYGLLSANIATGTVAADSPGA